MDLLNRGAEIILLVTFAGMASFAIHGMSNQFADIDFEFDLNRILSDVDVKEDMVDCGPIELQEPSE